jgi:hypothetical protein
MYKGYQKWLVPTMGNNMSKIDKQSYHFLLSRKRKGKERKRKGKGKEKKRKKFFIQQ